VADAIVKMVDVFDALNPSAIALAVIVTGSGITVLILGFCPHFGLSYFSLLKIYL
jgi:hypothetical protein